MGSGPIPRTMLAPPTRPLATRTATNPATIRGPGPTARPRVHNTRRLAASTLASTVHVAKMARHDSVLLTPQHEGQPPVKCRIHKVSVADARAYPWAAGASKYVIEVRAMTGANQMPGEIRMRVNQVMPVPIRRGQGRNVRRDWDPVPKD